MRACNGCRKRKIKCDAATTNTWPCSACTRLKLVCVPPTIGQDGDFAAEGPGMELPDGGVRSAPEGPHHTFPTSPVYGEGIQHIMGPLPSYDGMGMYSQYVQSPPGQPGIYTDMRSSPMTMPHQAYQQQPAILPGNQPASFGTERGILSDSDHSTAENLSDVLGELKIDETGIGRERCLQNTSMLIADRSKPHTLGDKGKIAQNPMHQFRTTLTRSFLRSAQEQARQFEYLRILCPRMRT